MKFPCLSKTMKSVCTSSVVTRTTSSLRPEGFWAILIVARTQRIAGRNAVRINRRGIIVKALALFDAVAECATRILRLLHGRDGPDSLAPAPDAAGRRKRSPQMIS